MTIKYEVFRPYRMAYPAAMGGPVSLTLDHPLLQGRHWSIHSCRLGSQSFKCCFYYTFPLNSILAWSLYELIPCPSPKHSISISQETLSLHFIFLFWLNVTVWSKDPKLPQTYFTATLVVYMCVAFISPWTKWPHLCQWKVLYYN